MIVKQMMNQMKSHQKELDKPSNEIIVNEEEQKLVIKTSK